MRDKAQDIKREDDEERLLQQALLGNKEALEKIYENNLEPIYSYVFRRVRNKDDAESLTSDIFTRAITGLSDGHYVQQEGKTFGAWLMGIAHNVYREWLRTHKKVSLNTVSIDDLDGEPPQKGVEEDILDLILTEEAREDLWDLVRELPLRAQKILVLRYKYDLSYAKIAEILEKSEKACKQHHYRAMNLLREKYINREKEIK